MCTHDERTWQEDANDLEHSEEWPTSRFEHLDPEDDQECDACGHEWRLHNDPYGCQYEPGDNFAGTMALPPCGCRKERSMK